MYPPTLDNVIDQTLRILADYVYTHRANYVVKMSSFSTTNTINHIFLGCFLNGLYMGISARNDDRCNYTINTVQT